MLTAAKIWKNLGYNKASCGKLIVNLKSYKEHKPPYNLPYYEEDMTPLDWWTTCYSETNQLQTLAQKLFSIIPHASTCERIWSSIGWIYGKRRTRLSVQNIESLTKIHLFYMSNIKNELKYYQSSISENEIINLIEESLNEIQEQVNEENESTILSSLDEIDTIVEDINQPEILKINSMFNLEPIVIIEYKDLSQFKINDQDDEDKKSENENEDYNIEDLVSNVLNI
jgi:hAT family C-terminal dimerisation region